MEDRGTRLLLDLSVSTVTRDRRPHYLSLPLYFLTKWQRLASLTSISISAMKACSPKPSFTTPIPEILSKFRTIRLIRSAPSKKLFGQLPPRLVG